MITLRSHPIRNVVRGVTLVAALASLVLAMLTTMALPVLAVTEHCPGTDANGAPALPDE